MKQSIKINQIWKNKKGAMRLLICGTSGGKWKTKILSDKPGVYRGSHTVNNRTLWLKYTLEQ